MCNQTEPDHDLDYRRVLRRISNNWERARVEGQQALEDMARKRLEAEATAKHVLIF